MADLSTIDSIRHMHCLQVLRYKIIRQRKSLGLSNQALAERLGISKKRLKKWIGCQEAIPARKLAELSRNFGGCSLDYLLARHCQRK